MDSDPPPSSHSSTYASFPILAISILGILTTAILLLSYYIFVTKCCLDWHRSDILLFFRLSRSRSRRRSDRDIVAVDPHMTYAHSCGLDPSTLNSIPTFRFNKISSTPSVECAVCLSDFQDQELLRILPNCSHSFHIDCIDTWLQCNTSCPLCRAEISLLPMQQFVIVPRPLVQDSRSRVVIELRDNAATSMSSSDRRRFWHMKSMGDECIDIRKKDETFVVQPMRRSFSMDSSNNRQLYVSVQEILQQNANLMSREVRNGEGSSNNGNNGSGRIRRSLFSFGRSFRSTSSVLPLQRGPL